MTREISKSEPLLKVDLALIHYPVTNKNRTTVSAAVTNLDLHDIARAGRTYGIDNYYLVTPDADQQKLVSEILAHWLHGYGSRYNTERKEALSIVRLCSDLVSLYAEVEKKWQQKPVVLATSARSRGDFLTYGAVRKSIFAGNPHLILFGTAWGLTDEVLAETDGILAPINGCIDYNHLSVRSAASIVLDRLLSKPEQDGEQDGYSRKD